MILLLFYWIFIMVLFINLFISVTYCFKSTKGKLIEVKDYIRMRFYILHGVYLCIWCSQIDQYLPIRLVSADKVWHCRKVSSIEAENTNFVIFNTL